MKTTMKLNEEQRRAVESRAEKRLVVAGPGSGKTRTLCAAAANLAQERGVKPERIVVVTFTNAAANELTGRLKEKHGVVGLGFCGTLHAFCLRLARENATELGLPDRVGVADDSQREGLLELVRDEIGIRCSARQALATLDECRGQLPVITGAVPAQWLLCKEYYRRMLAAGLLDYDMVLAQGLRAAAMAAKTGDWPYDALLVDEFQDAADPDADFYRVAPFRHKLVVGDADQAIYGFRGGNVANLGSLAQPDSGWETHLLESNYRSGSVICDHAQELVMHNADRVAKWTRAVRSGGTMTVQRCGSAAEELSFVLEQVQHTARTWKVLGEQADCWKEFAVLARTNRLAQSFAQHLAANGVPVRRAKVKMELADWSRTKLLLTVLDDPWRDLPVAQLLKLDHGAEQAKAARDKAAKEMTCLSEALGFPYGDGAYSLDVDLAKHGASPESRERVHAAMRELARAGQETTIPELLLYLRATDQAVEEEGEGVTCCTVHAAKGREWRHVFVVGCEEGTLPSGRKGTNVEEERRLMFVAMTRAAESLTLTWCASRPQWRGEHVPPGPEEARQPSRFIREAGL